MHPFENLDKEKQKKILNAAFKEFAEHGYEHASTNKIVKNAGIGKGMLFYYFKSKKDLYYYLINYGLNFIKKHYLDLINTDESDFIKRLVEATKLKLKAYTKHPELFHFLGDLLINDDLELPAELKDKFLELRQLGYDIMFDNIDTTLFREDIDIEKAFQLIRWSIEGYQNHIIEELKGKKISDVNFDPYWEEFFGYLAVLRRVYYREEKA